MTDKNIDSKEVQAKLANTLDKIAVGRMAIEQLEEQDKELLEDVRSLYSECGDKKSMAEVKMVADVYCNAKKAEDDEKEKVNKAHLKLEKIEVIKDQLSVLDPYKMSESELADKADEYLG